MEKSLSSGSFLDEAGCWIQTFDPAEEVNESGKTVMGEGSPGRGRSGCWGGTW